MAPELYYIFKADPGAALSIKMACFRLFLVALVFCFVSAEKSLPSYIKACGRNDPNRAACVKKNAESALPMLVKGDKKFKIPVLSPYKLPLIDIDQGSSFKLKLSNCIVSGLDGILFDKTDIDPVKKTVHFKGIVPRMNILSDYEINGKILVLPIVGSGPANITFVNCKYDYKLSYDVINKDGEEYMKVKDTNLSFVSERSYYKLSNLFNGDKTLGAQMESFLDENWEALDKDLNPPLAKTVDTVISDILGKVVEVVPYKMVLLP